MWSLISVGDIYGDKMKTLSAFYTLMSFQACMISFHQTYQSMVTLAIFQEHFVGKNGPLSIA